MCGGNCSIKRVVLSISLMVLVILFAASTESCSKKQDSVLKKIKDSGEIVVGTSADYPPFEFYLMNDKEEDIVGIDIDIANVIAEELGVKLEVKDIIFSKLFDALNSNQVDFAIAGLTPTDHRKKIVDFSDIYYQALQNILIRSKDADKIRSIVDLRGKKVGTQKDSIQEDIVRNQIVGAKFVIKETMHELIDDLKNERIDAIVLEKPVAESYAYRNKNFINIKCSSEDTPLGSAIAVKKGNVELLNAINKILRKLKKDNKINEFVEGAKILVSKR